MCVKYGRSRINDVHTISPSDPVGLPEKGRTVDGILFAKENVFCTTLESAIGRSAWG